MAELFEQIEKYMPLLIEGLGETLVMTLLSTALAYVLGLPLGIALVVTDPNGLSPMRIFNRITNVIINVIRSLPFLILLFTILPFTRAIVGTTIGTKGMIVPLVLCAFPFVARLVESSLNEVDAGVIEAMQSMGASNAQIAFRAMLPEALPSLITNATTATTTILGYSAMAGIVAAGGLGGIAINYGYYRKNMLLMLLPVIMLVIIVQIIQGIGGLIARLVDKRKS